MRNWPILPLFAAAIAFAAPAMAAHPRSHAIPRHQSHAMSRAMGEMHCPMMSGHVEGTLAFLKTEIKISDRQSSAWADFAEAFRNFSKQHGMQGMRQESNSDDDQQTDFPKRLDDHISAMERHVSAAKSFERAVEALYAELDRDQIKTANSLLPMLTMMQMKPMMEMQRSQKGESDR